MKREKLSYAEMLKDPRWQKRKSEILMRDNFTCQLCGDKKTTLHVHHKYYTDGKLPWEYRSDALVTLCENCHSWVHRNCPTDEIDLKIGDVIYHPHSDYDNYGIIFSIDYNTKNISSIMIDSGSGYPDCVIYHFDFNHYNVLFYKEEGFFEDEENFYAERLFYCFYGAITDNPNVNLDYYKKDYGIDYLLSLKYHVDEIFYNNPKLYDLYLTAENGNLDF